MTAIDPARAAELHAAEDLIRLALDDAYNRGRLEYLNYGPAWEATIVRMAALSWHLPSDSGGRPEGRDGTARVADRQSGVSASERIAQTPPPSPES